LRLFFRRRHGDGIGRVLRYNRQKLGEHRLLARRLAEPSFLMAAL
jgi:hypothetical protein